MPGKQVVNAAGGMQSPLLSQAIKYGDTIYVSGNVGINTSTMKMVEGSVADRTVGASLPTRARDYQERMLMVCSDKRYRISRQCSRRQEAVYRT